MRRALVLGLGRFGGGREAVRYLHRHGHEVRVGDRAERAALSETVAALADIDGIDWRLGDESLALLDAVDLVVANPAVADAHPVLVAARQRGLPITQEIELFLNAYPGRVVLVTGTNGKSTTATLLARALRTSGIDVLLGGNVGHSLLADETQWRSSQVAVVEISSFQLDRLGASGRRATGAVFTRVTRDHLDRHGTLAAYHGAKARAAALAQEFIVHAADDAVAAAFATTAARRVTFSLQPPPPGAVGVDQDWVVSRLDDPGRILHVGALRMLGAFQVENVLAAFAGAALLGAQRDRAGLACATAPPLRHRLQCVLQRGGVRVFDNGVSTEVQSTAVALAAVPGPIRWIGGGKSKDGDFATVAQTVAPRLASAHLFGSAAAPMRALLEGRLPVTAHDRLTDALDAAWASAAAGDAILFSPGFASFDQYPNFRVRAEAFHAWLAELQQRPQPFIDPAAVAGRADGIMQSE